MADALVGAMRVAASGLQAQSTRLRVVTENLANANATGETPGADPYARQLVTFASAVDQASGLSLVTAEKPVASREPFRLERIPGHPAADEQGYVKMPNVSVLTELADMREANRSYEANVQVVKQAREMITMTIDLLRNS